MTTDQPTIEALRDQLHADIQALTPNERLSFIDLCLDGCLGYVVDEHIGGQMQTALSAAGVAVAVEAEVQGFVAPAWTKALRDVVALLKQIDDAKEAQS